MVSSLKVQLLKVHLAHTTLFITLYPIVLDEEEPSDNEEALEAETENTDELEEYTFIDENDAKKEISTAELLAKRNETLRNKKVEIGSLSAGLLENPEEKVMNLRSLLNIIDEEIEGIYFTVRKLAIMSLLEVFKDILPSYELKPQIVDGVKCMSIFKNSFIF